MRTRAQSVLAAAIVVLAIVAVGCADPGDGSGEFSGGPSEATPEQSVSGGSAGTTSSSTTEVGETAPDVEIVSDRDDCLTHGTEAWDTPSEVLVEAEGKSLDDPGLSAEAREVLRVSELGEYMDEIQELATGRTMDGITEEEFAEHGFDWGPTFGGIWLDRGVSKIVVQVTSLDAVDVDALYAAIPGGSDSLEVREVEYAEAELHQLADAANAAFDGVAWVNANLFMNRLDITTYDAGAVDLDALPDSSYCMYAFDPTRPELLAPILSASLAGDGSALTVEHEIGGADCYDFERVETEVNGSNLLVKVVILGPPPAAMCNAVLHFNELTVPIDPPVDPHLIPIQHPATPDHIGG